MSDASRYWGRNGPDSDDFIFRSRDQMILVQTVPVNALACTFFSRCHTCILHETRLCLFQLRARLVWLEHCIHVYFNRSWSSQALK